MYFYMNRHEWYISRIDSDTIKEMFEKQKGTEYEFVYGYTCYHQQIVYLNGDVINDSMYRTLAHELMHVYIYEYCSWNINLNEEILCDISANANDIIYTIVNNYKDLTQSVDDDISTTTIESMNIGDNNGILDE